MFFPKTVSRGAISDVAVMIRATVITALILVLRLIIILSNEAFPFPALLVYGISFTTLCAEFLCTIIFWHLHHICIIYRTSQIDVKGVCACFLNWHVLIDSWYKQVDRVLQCPFINKCRESHSICRESSVTIQGIVQKHSYQRKTDALPARLLSQTSVPLWGPLVCNTRGIFGNVTGGMWWWSWWSLAGKTSVFFWYLCLRNVTCILMLDTLHTTRFT